ncbi:integral membrane protein [Histoplasma capsulatum G186AR]|nr:integral membrane protein [Histoplasma capsulatum]QSS69315.1 integral membrane protein [Histoplasma capsulatum G186AR]
MTFLGMWACRWRELQPIVFGGSAANASSNDGGNNGTNQSGEDATGGEDGRGGGGGIFEFSRGRGRGRNREGYEMIAMKERADDPV